MGKALIAIVKYPYGIIIGFVVGIVVVVLFYVLGITLAEKAYYYTLSSIFQGLFAILALAGIFIVFQGRRFDNFIDKFDKDIRRDFKNIDAHFEKQNIDVEEIKNNYLEHRLMKEYFESLEKIKQGLTSKTEKRAYNSCCHKGFLIFWYRTKRDCMLASLKSPMILGGIMIILAIISLPLLTTNSSFPTIPMEVVLGFLVGGTVAVVFETIYVIHLSLWKDFPRFWQKPKYINRYRDNPSKIIEKMEEDPDLYKPCLDIIKKTF